MSKKKKIAKKNSKQAYMEKKVAIANIVASKRHVVENAVKDDINNSAETKPNTDSNLKQITVKNAEGDPDTTATILVQNQIDYVPKVSVIMPVYNVEPYLRQCLDSVVNQTLKEIEIICVDDGSTDKSLDILKEYAEKDKRITIITQKNLRAGIARNTGLSQAKGKFVHFCDSDDWVENEIYSECIAKNADIILFDAFKVDEHLDKKLTWKKDFLNKEKIDGNINSFEFEKCTGSPWGKLFNRSFINKYDIHFQNLRCCNDIYFVKLALTLAKDIEIVDKPLYNWRFNSKGNTSSTRGFYSECVVMFAKQLYKSLDKYALLDNYKDLLYKLCTDAFAYEYSQCVFEKRKHQIELYKEFLPESYFTLLMEKITPEISVIMPVYNAQDNLKRSLDSLLQQTFKNFEVIAINDGSRDNSLEILNFYKRKDHRVQVIDKKNEGPGIARNVGINVARGKYITFLDSDDFCGANMLEEYSKILKNTDADIVVSKFYKYSVHEHKVTAQGGHYARKTLYNTNELGDDLFTISLPMPWNKIFRRELLVNNNITFPNLKASEDVCFCYNAFACAQRIAFIGEAFVYWTYDNETSLHFTSGNKNFECSFLCFVELKKRLENINKYKLYEETFMKAFAHSCKWVINNSDLDVDVTLSTTRKYMQIFGIKRYPYWNNFVNALIKIYDRKEEIIVSLTSYPARIKTINQTIETLLNQSLKADKVILWLAPEQFPNKEADLPQDLLDLKNKGLIIDWYHDIRSYKKLIPTLKKYPNSIIITADDDLLFSREWLFLLYKSYVQNTKCVHCHRITRLYNDNNGNMKVLPRNLYLDEKKKYIQELCQPSAFNKLSGGAGTLFPPHCFVDDIYNEKLFKKLAPTSDDIWFWLMALLNGYKVKVVDNNLYELKYVTGTQEVGLTNINDANGNELFYEHLNNIIENFPSVKKFFSDDTNKNNQIVSRLYTNNVNIQRGNLCKWYKIAMGKTLNIDNPKTFNEKIQWLKLYGSTPIKTRLADKYLVRDWVKEKIGAEYLIPLLGVYDKFEDINFDKLPNQFVIKCNHGSGYNIIIKDKTKLDIKTVKEKLDKWMAEDFSTKVGYELHYKNIVHRIMIEQYIENKGTDDLYDYKFWCFNGKLEYIQFLSERNLDGLKMAFYDRKWHKQKFVYSHPLDKKTIAKPDNLDTMIMLAEKLSKGFSHVRVDFYRLNDGRIYFGEMTFTSASGICRWNDNHINTYFGKLIKLPRKAYNVDTGKYYKIKKRSVLKAYLLFPYYVYKVAKFNKEVARKKAQLFMNTLGSYRIDIKNFGKATNTVEVEANKSSVSDITWNTSQGGGKVVQGSDLTYKVEVKAVNDGVVRFDFKGVDRKYENNRILLWSDYKSIKIDGKEILSTPIETCYNDPFRIEFPVKDKQEIIIEAKRKYHQYTQDELKEMLIKLYPNDNFLKKNLMEFISIVDLKVNNTKGVNIE